MTRAAHTVGVIVRFPPALHARVVEAAQAHEVSIQKQIIAAIELGLQTQEDMDAAIEMMRPDIEDMARRALRAKRAGGRGGRYSTEETDR